MPTLSPTTSADSLAIVSSAVLFALLDTILDKGILDRSEIQGVLYDAKIGISARVQFESGTETADLMTSLVNHFA